MTFPMPPSSPSSPPPYGPAPSAPPPGYGAAPSGPSTFATYPTATPAGGGHPLAPVTFATQTTRRGASGLVGPVGISIAVSVLVVLVVAGQVGGTDAVIISRLLAALVGVGYFVRRALAHR